MSVRLIVKPAKNQDDSMFRGYLVVLESVTGVRSATVTSSFIVRQFIEVGGSSDSSLNKKKEDAVAYSYALSSLLDPCPVEVKEEA